MPTAFVRSARHGYGVPRLRRAAVSIAIVGGFDAGNYGDALFPLLARSALRERLGRRLKLTAYGFRDLEPGLRPYAVRDLSRLPAEISGHDLLLLGGGQLIRGDRLGPAFPPASPDVHDPLGIWLVPTLTALLAGVPVAWNAPGVSPTLPQRLDPLVATAVAGVRHLVVRDEQSSRWLAERAHAQAAVVPDTAFGLAGGARAAPGHEASAILADAGDPCPVPDRAAHAGVAPLARRPRGGAEGGACGRARGARAADRAGARRPRRRARRTAGATRAAPRWPGPAAMVELHRERRGSGRHEPPPRRYEEIAFGVPLWRPPSPPGWKYEEALERSLPGVTVFGRGPAGTHPFGAATPSGAVVALRARVDAHWDAVARLASEGEAKPPRVGAIVAALERAAALASPQPPDQ